MENMIDTKNKPAKRLSLQQSISYKKNYARSSDFGTLKNISITGAFLNMENSEHLHIDEKLTLTFSVSGRKRQVSANVVWKSKQGCGLKFKPSNNQDIQIIDDLIYFVESKKENTKSVLDNIFNKVS